MEKTKIAIFDLDGTLLDTPLPQDGRVEYKEKTGNDWPFAGWWGQPLSLSSEIFDIKPIKDVISDYKKEKRDPQTLMVMLTGRIKKLSGYVEQLLKDNNLSFDEYHYNTGGSTDISKIKTMDSLLSKYPEVDELSIYEDRGEHISIFKEWGNKLVSSGRLKSFKIFHIVDGKPKLV